jgi:hypothetical protein
MSGDTCAGFDWNPIAGAGATSAFAAVLAGFIFACIVFVLGDRRRDHSLTLVLFLASFFALACASYADAVLAGEVACLRGWTAMMFSSGLLAVGAGAVFCGLAWLFWDYGSDRLSEERRRLIRWFVATCSYCVVPFALLMMAVTGWGYLLDVATVTPVPTWLRLAVWGQLAVSLAAVVAVGLGWRPRVFSKPDTAAAPAAFTALAATVVNLVTLPLVTGRPAAAWAAPPLWLVAVATLIPLITSAAALLVVLCAVPAPAHGRAGPRPTLDGEDQVVTR